MKISGVRWSMVVTIGALVALNVFLVWRVVEVVTEPAPTPTATPTASVTPLADMVTPSPTLRRVRRPGNCDQARAWGLTAREAARWDHLDRDGDGVACYGD